MRISRALERDTIKLFGVRLAVAEIGMNDKRPSANQIREGKMKSDLLKADGTWVKFDNPFGDEGVNAWFVRHEYEKEVYGPNLKAEDSRSVALWWRAGGDKDPEFPPPYFVAMIDFPICLGAWTETLPAALDLAVRWLPLAAARKTSRKK